ncbi:MAG: NUDIX hydrolase [Alphaproteobacteria bacterium]
MNKKYFHYPEHPLVGIGVTVWREDRVLLIQRKNPPAQGQWSLPGGKQQVGETIFEAAVREVREETGVEVEPLGIITALDAITRDAAGKVEYHYTLVEVAAEWRAGEALADDDALGVRWVLPDEVEKLCAWSEVARVVRLSMLQRIL